MLDKKIKRNKFFFTFGTSIAGFFLLKSLPFNLVSFKSESGKSTISVKLNPHAISRQKAGNSDV
jgi:hypothetical protein